MGNSCKIQKACTICKRTRHNTDFHSSGKGRTSLKPYCKDCKHIYTGIKEGLLDPAYYIGLSYNTNILKEDAYGDVIYLHNGTYTSVSKEKAVRLVQQGAAHVRSESVIENITQQILGGTELRKYIYKRDKKRCHYCVNEGNTLDHVVPKYLGGLDTVLNLVCCCETCNVLKGNMTKEEFLRRMKDGDYDYFKKNWKPHVHAQMKITTKVCICCKIEKQTRQFSSQEVVCMVCSHVRKMLRLGYVTTEQVSTFSEGDFMATRLKKEEITAYFPDGTMHRMTKKAARECVQQGVAVVRGSKSITLLLPPQTLEEVLPFISPSFSVMMIKETEKRKSMETVTSPGNNEEIEIYNRLDNFLFRAKMEEVEILEEHGLLTFSEFNRYLLNVKVEKFVKCVQTDPALKELAHLLPYVFVNEAQNSVGLYDGSVFLKTIDIKLAFDLLQKGFAKKKNERRIVLVEHIDVVAKNNARFSKILQIKKVG